MLGGNYNNVDGSNTLIQWGVRPGNVCNSAFAAIGSQPSWGAVGSWNCDTGFGTAPAASMESVAGAGTRPTTGHWHHIVYSYSGAAGSPPYVRSIYVDGVVDVAQAGVQLAIQPAAAIYLGTMFQNGGWYADSVMGVLRIHDGCLSAAGVAANYAAEYVQYHPTPTPTATVSVTPPATPSVTGSPSGTQINSASVSPTISLTRTPSGTPTQSPGVAVAGSLLIELHAEDYDAAANAWDNRCVWGAWGVWGVRREAWRRAVRRARRAR